MGPPIWYMHPAGPPAPEPAGLETWSSAGAPLPQPGNGPGNVLFPWSEAGAARQQPEADHERTLLAAAAKAANKAVHLSKPGQPTPAMRRCGAVASGEVHPGSVVTAEAAALCGARSPQGQQAAAKRPAAKPPLTMSEEARQQARAEGLVLLVTNSKCSKTGYFGVSRRQPGTRCGAAKPFLAQVTRDGRTITLGSFATAEEAALCIARSPEGQQQAAKRRAAVAPLTSEEARQQAQAEGLTLLEADNTTGYYCVFPQSGKSKRYYAKVSRGGKQVSLGSFATAEEAALCVARSPEGQAAAKKAAAAASLTSKKVGRQDARSIRRKKLPGRREQVGNAVGARSAEEVAAEEDVLMVEVEVVEAEEAEEAEDVQVEVVGVVEGGRPKRRRNS